MHKPLWYIQNLDTNYCDTIRNEFLSIQAKDACMGENGDTKNAGHRNTTVRFAPKGHNLEKEMYSFALHANQLCNWDYDINLCEAVQFAEYQKGQHYGWHTDTFPLGLSKTDRKITVVCLLNNVDEFEGGQLKIRLYEEYDAPLIKGSMIAFPSILEHMVTPVTTGKRFSCVLWTHGPKFK
jgi:predicted 2-oxoglutarate/Fe(II)-dependent dioxygenase YbiX